MTVNRSSQQSAIVLRISPFGESHAMVDLLTEEEGLVPAVAYGLRSRRSSLRGKVVPFVRGVAWLYRDPRQERSKITDFEVERYALVLQHDLSAYYHASLWAEVVWRTHASGGDEPAVYRLIDDALSLIEDPSPDRCDARLVGLSVLWRYLHILGVQPDLERCIVSDRALAEAEVRYYHRVEGGVVGEEWSSPSMVRIEPAAVRLLSWIDERPFAAVRDLDIAEVPFDAARRFVLTVLQDVVAAPLNTLAVGGRLL